MNNIFIKLALVFILFLLVFHYVFKNDDKSNIIKDMKNNNLEFRDFNCLNTSFQFPDFKDWGLINTEKVRENLCVMYFNWPDGVEYEVAPKIEVHKIEKKPSKDTSVLPKNPQNISYEYIQDPSLYIDGHKFEEGDWDWLVFYGAGFNVKIERAMFGEPPFDADQFYKKIIETFDFK